MNASTAVAPQFKTIPLTVSLTDAATRITAPVANNPVARGRVNPFVARQLLTDFPILYSRLYSHPVEHALQSHGHLRCPGALADCHPR